MSLINPQDWDAHAQQYRDIGYCVVDDFLDPFVVDKLRQWFLSARRYDIDFRDGYHSINYVPDGTSAWHPLLSLVVNDLSRDVPLVRGLAFSRAWSFIYDNQSVGIGEHADPAAVNVNHWVTPDDAVLDPSCNGMRIWPVEPPADWTWKQYNADENGIRAFLAKSGCAPHVIGYRYNRAVIFNSKFFHRTDRVSMKPGHENKRINFTYLYA